MFAKLLKHEWRATWRVLGLLCVIILVSGAAIGLAGIYVTMVEQYPVNDNLMATMILLLVIAAMIAIAVCCAGGIAYLIWRFYQRCFADEGFLTFTLPVSTHGILLSSAANTICGSIVIFLAGCASVVMAVCLLFGALIVAAWENIVWADVMYSFGEVWDALVSSLAKNWQNLFLVLGSGIINWISSLLLIMLAVTMGCILAKKHKVLVGVASYYGINIVLGLIPLMLVAGKELPYAFQSFMGYSMAQGLLSGAVCYFLMQYLVGRKLNLN